MILCAALERSRHGRSEAGYTLIELMIAVGVLMIVSASVFNGIQQLTRVSQTVNNRSEMHAGVRNATELLQQEIGQAGKISLPGPVWLTQPIPNPGVQTVPVNSVEGMFVGQTLTIDSGPFVVGVAGGQESVFVTAIDEATNTITANFQRTPHPQLAPVRTEGGFFAGVVPVNYLNGSTDTVLKIFGDINGDGKMVYIEYTCDWDQGNLYRNAMLITEPIKPPGTTVAQVLLNNIQANPGVPPAPCFTYQEETVAGMRFVTDVAITLTVHTERPDPVTGLLQTETKALLNVSPRNVFQVWQLASLNMTDRVQSVPASVTNLLIPN